MSSCTQAPTTGLYRSRNNLLFGVCAGFAEYLNLNVFWTRIIVLVAFIMTGFWPVGAIYLVAALLMRKNPATIWYEESCCPRDRHKPRPPRRPGNLNDRMRGVQESVSRAADWDERLRRGI
jgi:phage shock protein C